MIWFLRKKFTTVPTKEDLESTVLEAITACDRKSTLITRQNLITEIFKRCTLKNTAATAYHKNGDLRFFHVMDAVLSDLKKKDYITSEGRGKYSISYSEF